MASLGASETGVLHDFPRFLVTTAGCSTHDSVGRSLTPGSTQPRPDLSSSGRTFTLDLVDAERWNSGRFDRSFIVRVCHRALDSRPLLTVFTSRALDRSSSRQSSARDPVDAERWEQANLSPGQLFSPNPSRVDDHDMDVASLGRPDRSVTVVFFLLV